MIPNILLATIPQPHRRPPIVWPSTPIPFRSSGQMISPVSRVHLASSGTTHTGPCWVIRLSMLCFMTLHLILLLIPPLPLFMTEIVDSTSLLVSFYHRVNPTAYP